MNCNINFFNKFSLVCLLLLSLFFFLQTYIHKETRFRCRSLEEIKNYENHEIPPQCHKVKTQDKEESDNKTKNETELSIFIFKK